MLFDRWQHFPVQWGWRSFQAKLGWLFFKILSFEILTKNDSKQSVGISEKRAAMLDLSIHDGYAEIIIQEKFQKIEIHIFD